MFLIMSMRYFNKIIDCIFDSVTFGWNYGEDKAAGVPLRDPTLRTTDVEFL